MQWANEAVSAKVLARLSPAIAAFCAPEMRIGVGIASSGRPDALRSLMENLNRQERKADAVLLCSDDVGPAIGSEPWPFDVQVMAGPQGLCAKRNLILSQADDLDVLVFFDDDFLPDVSYLREVAAAFERDRRLVVLTGLVLADGVNGTEIDETTAREMLLHHRSSGTTARAIEPVYNAYGCNMAVRLDVVRARGAKFDETLPLYGWLEDVDFSRRLAEAGRIEKHQALFGVHRGVKVARLSGTQFGYSQLANSLYLVRKGTLERQSSLNQIVRNVAKNALLALWPEPWCDRRGRLRGNLLAIGDLLRGRLDVRRVLDL